MLRSPCHNHSRDNVRGAEGLHGIFPDKFLQQNPHTTVQQHLPSRSTKISFIFRCQLIVEQTNTSHFGAAHALGSPTAPQLPIFGGRSRSLWLRTDPCLGLDLSSSLATQRHLGTSKKHGDAEENTPCFLLLITKKKPFFNIFRRRVGAPGIGATSSAQPRSRCPVRQPRAQREARSDGAASGAGPDRNFPQVPRYSRGQEGKKRPRAAARSAPQGPAAGVAPAAGPPRPPRPAPAPRHRPRTHAPATARVPGPAGLEPARPPPAALTASRIAPRRAPRSTEAAAAALLADGAYEATK